MPRWEYFREFVATAFRTRVFGETRVPLRGGLLEIEVNPRHVYAALDCGYGAAYFDKDGRVSHAYEPLPPPRLKYQASILLFAGIQFLQGDYSALQRILRRGVFHPISEASYGHWHIFVYRDELELTHYSETIFLLTPSESIRYRSAGDWAHFAYPLIHAYAILSRLGRAARVGRDFPL